MPDESPQSPPPAERTDRELIESAAQDVDAEENVVLRLPSGSSWPDSFKDKPALTSDSIPGYSILREIHRGGQGVVYQAVQKTTRRKVAIKVVREGPFASRHDKTRFEREVQVLAALKHPNIVAIHESGTAAGSFYFVMDYVSGEPLDVYMAAERRSVREMLAVFQKICEAVNAAHLRGVIHRDLKPGNIRMDVEGEPQILDFGLAKVALGDIGDECVPMTVTGQFVGSLPWASPEQAEGTPSKIDIRTDVYSLGVILYQMLTGQFPYPTVGSFHEVLSRIMTAPPTRPRVLCSEIDDEVETILLKCLAKERERRYQSSGELARDIGHYLTGEPIEAKRDSSWYVLRKSLRRYRTAVAVTAGFVLLLAVGMVVSLSQKNRALKAEQLANRRLLDGLVQTGDSGVRSKQYAEARQAYRGAWDLARQMSLPDIQPRLGWLNSYMNSPPPLLRYDLGEEEDGVPPRRTLFCMTRSGPLVAVQRRDVVSLLNPLSGSQVAALVGHSEWIRDFDVSPDEQLFCTAAQDRTSRLGTVRLWEAASQKELEFIRTNAPVISSLFSPDGTAVFWSDDDGRVTGRELATGKQVWAEPVNTGIPEAHLLISPNGRWLAVAGGHTLSALISTKTGKFDRFQAMGGLGFSSDSTQLLTGHLDEPWVSCTSKAAARGHVFPPVRAWF